MERRASKYVKEMGTVLGAIGALHIDNHVLHKHHFCSRLPPKQPVKIKITRLIVSPHGNQIGYPWTLRVEAEFKSCLANVVVAN